MRNQSGRSDQKKIAESDRQYSDVLPASVFFKALKIELIVLSVLLLTSASANAGRIHGFRPSHFFDEQTATFSPDEGVRVLLNAAGDFDAGRPTQLVIFALPNGNTIEQTMGCAISPGMDWHFDIQHVAAQIRVVREASPGENVVVAAVEANTKSWPAWRKALPDRPARIRKIVDAISGRVPGAPVRITLACHSGGGSFLFAFIDGGDAIPPAVSRMAWLDATYSYDDPEKHHGDKLLAWLTADPKNTLAVVSYDDRNITLDGKKVVSDTGGTYRATHRMIDRLNLHAPLTETHADPFEKYTGMNGQIDLCIHTNPEVKILHTVLVERNGLIRVLTVNTPAGEKWATHFWEPRVYAKYIQAAPTDSTQATQPVSLPTTQKTGVIPPRPADAKAGKAFAESIDDLPPKARDAAVVQEMLRGNIPSFLRKLKPVTIKSGGHTAIVRVMPDYLAVGSDSDFLRMPMTPASAKTIADAFGCALPTTRIVDAIYQHADVKIEPKPLTEKREATSTFAEHNAIIESQRPGESLGKLIAGTKKDIVLTNKLAGKPDKVAIYGWHKLDGKPIQPLYTGHASFYADYSHGVRLVSRTVTVEGVERDLFELLANPSTCAIVGEEQPISDADSIYR